MVVKGVSVSMAEQAVISQRKTHLHHHHHPKKIMKRKEKELMDSDMAAAAQQLMQLSSDEENNSKKHRVDDIDEDNGEVDQRPNGNCVNNSTSLIMEEIFGKDEVSMVITNAVVANKKRRYRSLADIYMETKPIVYLLCSSSTTTSSTKKLRSN